MSAEPSKIIASLGLLAMPLLTQFRLLLHSLCRQSTLLGLGHLSVNQDTQVFFHSSTLQPGCPLTSTVVVFLPGYRISHFSLLTFIRFLSTHLPG